MLAPTMLGEQTATRHGGRPTGFAHLASAHVSILISTFLQNQAVVVNIALVA